MQKEKRKTGFQWIGNGLTFFWSQSSENFTGAPSVVYMVMPSKADMSTVSPVCTAACATPAALFIWLLLDLEPMGELVGREVKEWEIVLGVKEEQGANWLMKPQDFVCWCPAWDGQTKEFTEVFSSIPSISLRWIKPEPHSPFLLSQALNLPLESKKRLHQKGENVISGPALQLTHYKQISNCTNWRFCRHYMALIQLHRQEKPQNITMRFTKFRPVSGNWKCREFTNQQNKTLKTQRPSHEHIPKTQFGK